MMMCNLFFIFDPSLSLMSLSQSVFLLILVIPLSLFLNNSTNFVLLITNFFFKKEMKSNIYYIPKGLFSFLMTTFTVLFVYNFLALMPHIFSLTSHLVFNTPLSYSLWMTIFLFILCSFFKNFTSHFIPLGTPTFLMSFMVIVEILSNIIRPLALTFRLTANMMAGHLLLSLISSSLISLNMIFFTTGYLIQFFLIIMEMGVSLIQAYVFYTLLTLYTSEGKP